MSTFETDQSVSPLDPAATSADIRDRLKRKYPPPKSQWIALAFIAPALVLVVAFFLVPLIMAIWMSLHNWPLMGTPKFTGLTNYIRLASDKAFLNALLFTGKYTVVVTLAIFAVAFPLALFVDRKSRLTGFFRTSYFLPSVVGFATSCLLWVWLLSPDNGLFSVALQRLGWVDKPVQFIGNFNLAFASIIVMVVWRMAGFTMLLLLTGIQAIPHDIQEAARIDGATAWQRFKLITLPLMRRTLALTMVMSIAGSILAFDQFYIITLGGPRRQTMTAVYQIYNTSFISFKLGYGAAMSVVLMLILVALTVIQLYVLRNKEPSK
ncbi:MAG: sugar ABC transporter permease [Planctomycetaceae bacterium]|nr:sugar ABC transporter permease [Planctomycetaceae bacterium]